ncbi:hypothetical protein JF078_003705 [Salmonella enterica]|nr:hypothetical protein [Salmonella enterica]EBS4770472.1 hypothetical protein [Salmonella enterica subsp. enterica serovar Sandiego]ECU4587607.1 hypothetical protein [Salmonella enterica subsp. enterica]EDQ5102787.1 hypothetical protein [Salmonella enterica subsp. enterica serovar Saintpaul]EDX2040575.1 hypothetical protein [Salmonella enterica subsp. houtenae serovar 50:z4,z23:-]EEE1764856.1 hypothetical protein [Salmonella enterica subsp. houtenae serovar 48:z4,z32:-]
MINPHTTRILVWFVFSLIGSGFYWLAFKRPLNQAYAALRLAREDLEKARAYTPKSIEYAQAQEQLQLLQKKVSELKRQRISYFPYIPGGMAILILFIT